MVVEILSETPVSPEPGKGALDQPYEGSMKNSLMLRQIDQARGDLYGMSEDLAVIQVQLAAAYTWLLPIPGSPEEMARLTLATS